MSRIHEALKKAEQERAATQGGGVPPGYEPVSVADTTTVADRSSSVAVAALAEQGMPSFTSPFSVDTLLSRCAQTEWKPDLSTMLFMNGNDGAEGTEQ